MKRLFLFLLAAALLSVSGLLPFERRDAAALEPLEALVVSVDGNQVIVDGGSCRGLGVSFDEAMEDLGRSGQGDVFFGTVSQVILAEPAVRLLPQIVKSPSLRPAAALSAAAEPPDPEDAAAYLAAHDPGLTIGAVRTALVRGTPIRLPRLVETEGGLRLDGAVNG